MPGAWCGGGMGERCGDLLGEWEGVPWGVDLSGPFFPHSPLSTAFSHISCKRSSTVLNFLTPSPISSISSSKDLETPPLCVGMGSWGPGVGCGVWGCEGSPHLDVRVPRPRPRGCGVPFPFRLAPCPPRPRPLGLDGPIPTQAWHVQSSSSEVKSLSNFCLLMPAHLSLVWYQPLHTRHLTQKTVEPFTPGGVWSRHMVHSLPSSSGVSPCVVPGASGC